MQKTFDHLLGLNARTALAILAGYGVTDVRVTLTGAPPMAGKRAPACVPKQPERIRALDAIAKEFSAGDEEDDPTFDPLLDDALDAGMLVESRVVAVQDDGRLLVVARFHVGEPKPCEPEA